MAATKKKASSYGTKKFSTIDEYHSSFPENVRQKLEQIRQVIKASA